jgi:transposase InsO family protein
MTSIKFEPQSSEFKSIPTIFDLDLIKMRMTAQYGPYGNAIAERINKTLKYEYGLRNCIKNTDIAQEITK